MADFHSSRRSRRPAQPVTPVSSRPIPPHWEEAARKKGFSVHSRDPGRREGLLLRCLKCGELSSVHRYAMTIANPVCTPCYDAELAREAEAAGLTFLGRDPTNSHYGRYRGDCGHDLRRQRGYVQQVGRGERSIRCAVCLEERYDQMAGALGWTLVGKVRNRRGHWRRFRHSCGHEQDMTLQNLATQRFDCRGCGASWTAARSSIYLVTFDVPGRGKFVKLGIARHPDARLRDQLLLRDDIATEVVQVVAVATGHAALVKEKGAHKVLRREFPGSVVPAADLDWITVRSEVYGIEVLPRARELMEAFAADSTAPAP